MPQSFHNGYEVQFEIAGPFAMFTRFDSGIPISYPTPTFSAVKGMFEAVARKYGAYFLPKHIEICKPIKYERYVTNYGGPLRSDSQRKGNTNAQVFATVLSDVRYRIYGAIEADGRNVNTNAAHALQEIFLRRLEAGQCYYTPCLGWKQFLPDYFGPLRNDQMSGLTADASLVICPICGKRLGSEGVRNRDVNLIIPSLMHMVFDLPVGGKYAPSFRQNVEVRDGILCFEQEAYHAD